MLADLIEFEQTQLNKIILYRLKIVKTIFNYLINGMSTLFMEKQETHALEP